jgi:hypothetical protein
LKLLLFGGKLVGEGFDFIALPLGLIALLVGVLGALLRGGGIRFCFLLIGNSFLLVSNGLGLGCRRSDGLPGTDRGSENQACCDDGNGGKGGFVFAGEFLEAVHGSWGASEDRFVGKITLYVGGKGGRRLIATAAILIESFYHYPVELAAKRR